jgi:hypothetical protein
MQSLTVNEGYITYSCIAKMTMLALRSIPKSVSV